MSSFFKAGVLALSTFSLYVSAVSTRSKRALPYNAQQVLNESMGWLDTFYDPSAGYLYDESATTALRHETRSSVWYALGLLARNERDDAQQAAYIITNVIDAQFKDPAEQW